MRTFAQYTELSSVLDSCGQNEEAVASPLTLSTLVAEYNHMI